MDSVFFLNFLTICFIAECRSATVKRIGEGTWEGKKYDSVSNIQASTRVLTKYKPEMVSIFYYLPKSRKVRFKWMQKQKFLVFFFCSPVVVVAVPVADPDPELSGRGERFFCFACTTGFYIPALRLQFVLLLKIRGDGDGLGSLP